jgi:hypothetical protein
MPVNLFHRPDLYAWMWQGAIPLSSVRFEYASGASMRLSAYEKADINSAWDKLGLGTENRELYRFSSFEATANNLVIQAGITTYKEFVGTNLTRPLWARGNAEKLSDPVAIGAVVVTSDDMIMLQKRSATVLEYPHALHIVPGGHIHPPDSPSVGLFAELLEELDITELEVIGDPLLTGIVRTVPSHKVDLCGLLKVSLTAAEVYRRSGVDSWEFERLFPMATSGGTLSAALNDHRVDWVPPGHASLVRAAALFGFDKRHPV